LLIIRHAHISFGAHFFIFHIGAEHVSRRRPTYDTRMPHCFHYFHWDIEDIAWLFFSFLHDALSLMSYHYIARYTFHAAPLTEVDYAAIYCYYRRYHVCCRDSMPQSHAFMPYIRDDTTDILYWFFAFYSLYFQPVHALKVVLDEPPLLHTSVRGFGDIRSIAIYYISAATQRACLHIFFSFRA
jgi:hypothetical protein